MDGNTMLRMYLMPLNYTLKIVKMLNFMLHIFYHNKNLEEKRGKIRTEDKILK